VRVVLLGTGLTGVVTAVLVIAWGRAALLPAVVFGGLATGIQWVAWRAVQPVLEGPFARVMSRWAIGMGLRLGGVVAFVVAVIADRELFPPLPTAFGYLGVVVPLLVLETRWLR
jgi:hypothetical protein